MTRVGDSNSAGEVCVAVVNGVVEINPFRSLRLYVAQKRVKYSKPGRCLVFRREDLDRFIMESEVLKNA